MSIIHTIITKQPLDISILNSYISKIENANYEERYDKNFYFWIEGKSTRGFDITIYEQKIEIRNTVLSNRYDYEMTNKVVNEILKLTDGMIVDEEDQEKVLPLFVNEIIIENELNDCQFIHNLSNEHEDIEIFGPTRQVHFGKRLHNSFKGLNRHQLKSKIFEIILAVNYELPNYEYGNIIQIGNTEDDKKTMKLLTNKTNYIIDKYDYILLDTSEEKPIIITNEILNSMLPSNWKLIDEFTVVAPITSNEEWATLLSNAEKYNLWDSFKKQ